MNCPSCKKGIIRRFPVGASNGLVVVCDNADCNHFFRAVDGNLTKDLPVTTAISKSITDKNEFQAMISGLRMYG